MKPAHTPSLAAGTASHRLGLFFFLGLVVGGGLAIGYLTTPGEWYARLAKPAFTPPGWIFGPVWTGLYVMIAVAGWRAWRHSHKGPLQVWWVQLVLNFLWSPAFFAAHQIGIALILLLLLLATIVAFIGLSWRQDRAAAGLFMPYAAWVGFATVLNASIFALN